MTHRPQYDRYRDFSSSRGELAERLASQILATTAPWLSKDETRLDVLDVGSGYGTTAIALSRRCASVVGCEPAEALHHSAVARLDEVPHGKVQLTLAGVEDLDYFEQFDLVVLDNVYEHLPNQRTALETLVRAMRPGGVLYILVPNKLWPVEAHYDLLFLSWLPLRIANLYLRMARKGTSYEDASYAPTYWGLARALRRSGLEFDYVLPAVPDATVAGAPWHYRLGMAALRRMPALWCVSKALLVVARKPATG